ncbi:MAG: thiamine pyrophosphate-dependent enzyme [Gammaproteobacteria bacterium]
MGKSKQRQPVSPSSSSLDRRSFLKGAAVGATALATKTPKVEAQQSEALRPSALPPSEAQLASLTGPSPSHGGYHFVENPTSDFMVDVIKSLNLDYITTNPGSSFEGLHESLINYGGNKSPELLTCLHEESAVAMAHGYAKIEGRPMMALLHGTVGLMHGSMAIYNAYADRVPVYIMAANHQDPAGGVNAYHSAQDLGALVRDFVKWDAETLSAEQFAQSAVRAYKIGMTPPMGPTLVVIDHEMQGEPLSDRSRLRVPKLTMAAPPQGDANAVREAARMLVEAQSPLISAQRYARTPDGIDLLVELAELLQAPVTGGERVNFPWRHPLYGRGGFGYEPDVILALEVNDMYNQVRAAQRTGAKTISISSVDLFHGSNIHDYGRYAELDLSIAADAQATLPALIEEVRLLLTDTRRRELKVRGEMITAEHALDHEQSRIDASYGWNSSPVSLARLCAELWGQIKNDDWSLVSWQNFISQWPGRLWNIEKHYHYIGGQGGAGIGYNAPASVGAALANKKHGRLSINIQTDGDLNYAPGVLWTAVHHKIPLLTVMHNNRAYHAEVMFVQRQCAERKRGSDRAHIGTTIRDPNINYAKMAETYGMYGEGPIENPDDLGPALQRALARVRAGEPALVDVITQPR